MRVGRVFDMKLAVILFPVSIALSACSTGAYPVVPPTPTPTLVTPTAPNYVTMNDTRYILVPISGDIVSYLRVGSSQFAVLPGFESVSGTYSTSDGAIDLSLTNVVFVDADGPDSGSRLSDGNLSGTITSIGSGYEYVRILNLTDPYNAQGNRQSWFGYVGILTAPSDMPTAGTATFVGGAQSSFRRNSNFLTLYGDSELSVDFAAGSANLTMDFTSWSGAWSAVPNFPGPVTQIIGTDMQISGSRLTGGTWTASGTHGTPTDLLGRMITTSNPAPPVSASGSFYGYDPATSGPAEVAGLVVVDGYYGGTRPYVGGAEYYFWALRQP